MQSVLLGILILLIFSCGNQGEESKNDFDSWAGPASDYYLDRGASFNYFKSELNKIGDESLCLSHYKQFWRHQFINQLKAPFNHHPFSSHRSGQLIQTMDYRIPNIPFFYWERNLLSHNHSFSDGIKLQTSIIYESKFYRWSDKTIYLFFMDKFGDLVFEEKIVFDESINILGIQSSGNRLLVFTEDSEGYKVQQLNGNTINDLNIIYQSTYQMVDVLFEGSSMYLLDRSIARLPSSMIKKPIDGSPYSVYVEEFDYFNQKKSEILRGEFDDLIPEVENCSSIYFNHNLGNFSNGISTLIKIDLSQDMPTASNKTSFQGSQTSLGLSEGKIIVADRVFDEAVPYFQVHLFNDNFSLEKSFGGEGDVPLDHFTFIQEGDLYLYATLGWNQSYLYSSSESSSDGYDSHTLLLPSLDLRPLVFNKHIYLLNQTGYQYRWTDLFKFSFTQGKLVKKDELQLNGEQASIGKLDDNLVIVKRSEGQLMLSVYSEDNYTPLSLIYEIELETQLIKGKIDTQINHLSDDQLVITLHQEYKEEVFVFNKNSSSDQYELFQSWLQFNQKWRESGNNCPFHCCWSPVEEHQNYRPSNSTLVLGNKLYHSTLGEVRTIDLTTGDIRLISYEDL